MLNYSAKKNNFQDENVDGKNYNNNDLETDQLRLK